MDANFSGRRQHFTFFPRGENAAVYFAEQGTAWVQIKGALSDEGAPYIAFKLEPLRLDTLELPATFTVKEPTKDSATLSVEWSIGPTESWQGAPNVEQPMQVTLSSFEGKTLRGTFEGTLAPTPPNSAPPIEITRGEFAVDLRLNNINRQSAETP